MVRRYGEAYTSDEPDKLHNQLKKVERTRHWLLWHDRGNVLSHLHITRDLRVSHTHQQLVANLQPAGGAYSLVDTRAACRLLGT